MPVRHRNLIVQMSHQTRQWEVLALCGTIEETTTGSVSRQTSGEIDPCAICQGASLIFSKKRPSFLPAV
jgi:hypothetical protein